MASISNISPCDLPETDDQTPLLEENLTGVVDYKGLPANRNSSGGWRSAAFLIGAEVAERFAYYGISSNLITYLTGPLEQSTATAAANVNAWLGTDLVLPFLGAFIADSYLGHYRTIVFSSLVYILGLGLLTLSASLPSSPSQFQVILFFSSLYLAAIGQAAQKPCIEAFGAAQFDAQHPEEIEAKSSFFNWWFFGVCSGILIALLLIVYIQDNLSWSLGFGIPCISMVISLVLFLLGTKTYRYQIKEQDPEKRGSFARIGNAFSAVVRNRGKSENGCIIDDDIEEAKAALRLIPIWTTSLVYAIVIAQCPTFFTKQASTMDRAIFGFTIPAASLQALTTITILFLIPIYDRVFVPIARAFTGKPTGITLLQRIGTGMFLSAVCVVVAAVVETERLNNALDYGMVGSGPGTAVLMSVWWLVPQYMLIGAADVFTRVGLQEFFYEQVGKDMKSVGLALYLSVFGVGNFVSSFLVSLVEKVSGWLSDDLNQAHLNYFYCVLVGINVVGFVAFLYFATAYIYKRKSPI